MSVYTPDKWVVVKITLDDDTLYKVFGTWYGGYLDGDSWRLNSGITKVYDDDRHIYFEGHSGSTYFCDKDTYGMSPYTYGVLHSLIERANGKITLLDEDTDWLNLKENNDC